MEDYIVYRRVTLRQAEFFVRRGLFQGAVIKAKSIKDANKKTLLNPPDDFEFIGSLDDQKYLPQKTIRLKDAKEELKPDSLRVYKKRK